MALGIPLPRAVADVGPGGQFLTALKAQNAFARDQAQLHKQGLMNQILEAQAAAAPKTMQQKIDRGMAQNRLLDLRGQYYGPQQEAQIAQRQAATERMQTLTPLDAQKAQLAAQQQQFQLGTINPLKQQQLQQQVEAFPELTAAKITQMKRKPVGRAGAMGNAQRKFDETVAEDHPEWDQATLRNALDAYYEGKTQLPDGTELPRLRGRAMGALAGVRRFIAPAALRTQTAQMRGLLADMKAVNIASPMFFAGLKGQAKAAKYATAMAAGRPVPPIYREYLAFKNITSKANMDKMRKAFGSTVVPEYVNKFIGPLTDPQSKFWQDPEQVRKNWNASLKYVERNTQHLIRMNNLGVTAAFDEAPQSRRANDTSLKDVPKGAMHYDLNSGKWSIKQ